MSIFRSLEVAVNLLKINADLGGGLQVFGEVGFCAQVYGLDRLQHDAQRIVDLVRDAGRDAAE